MEEISSVAMAVQNMSLMAVAHGIGAYWSSGSVFDKKAMAEAGSSTAGGDSSDSTSSLLVINPKSTRDYLKLQDDDLFLGWMFVGDFFGEPETNGAGGGSRKNWPEGRRKELQAEGRLLWK